jgi:hypothetical protein
MCLTLVGMTAAFLVGFGAPAQANNCQPDEFVFGEDGGPYDKRDSAFCFVMDTWVYPFVCPDGDANGDQNGEISPGECAANVDPDLGNPPNPMQITQFRPNAFRIYCNAYLWIWEQLDEPAVCVF